MACVPFISDMARSIACHRGNLLPLHAPQWLAYSRGTQSPTTSRSANSMVQQLTMALSAAAEALACSATDENAGLRFFTLDTEARIMSDGRLEERR